MMIFKGAGKKIWRQARTYLRLKAREVERKLPPGTPYAVAVDMNVKKKRRSRRRKVPFL
jgi:hypothetical protein